MFSDRLIDDKIKMAVNGLWGVKVNAFTPYFFYIGYAVGFNSPLMKIKCQKWTLGG